MGFASVNLNSSFNVVHMEKEEGMMLLEVRIYVIICIDNLQCGGV